MKTGNDKSSSLTVHCGACKQVTLSADVIREKENASTVFSTKHLAYTTTLIFDVMSTETSTGPSSVLRFNPTLCLVMTLSHCQTRIDH